MNDSDRNPNSCRPRDPATDASRCASTTGASKGHTQLDKVISRSHLG